MNKFFLVVLACYGLNAHAQVQEPGNFIYLYSDSVIHAKTIRIRPDIYNSLQIRADSKRIPVDKVKFFQTQDGFFANTKKLNHYAMSAFTERIIEGRINLYQQVSYDPFLVDDGFRFRNRRPNSVVDSRMFYNKGYEDIRKVSYANLMRDMSDRPESMQLLAGYRKSMNTTKVLYISAGASVLAGLIYAVVVGSNTDRMLGTNGVKEASFAPSFALLGASAGLALGGYFAGESGKRHLEAAVDAYNK